LARVSLSIDDFILERPVGRGGMGEVWRGRHRHSLMPVAIKLLSENSAKSQVYHHAFRREMRAAASLDHPNIVKVYDYGTVDGGTI
jgi:serine/threonine protein kinase